MAYAPEGGGEALVLEYGALEIGVRGLGFVLTAHSLDDSLAQARGGRVLDLSVKGGGGFRVEPLREPALATTVIVHSLNSGACRWKD